MTVKEKITEVDGKLTLTLSPEPGTEVCDFCSETPIVKGYPCPEFTMEVQLLGRKLNLGTDNLWAACATCAALIDAGDSDGLCQRSIEKFDGPMGEEGRVFIRNLHAKFWELKQ